MKNRFNEENSYKGSTEIRIHSTCVPEPEAELAVKIMGNLSVVACMPDGEDGARRQKFRLLTPYEVAERAANIAEAAFLIFEHRKWLMTIPVPKPVQPKQPDQDAGQNKPLTN